VRANIAPRHGRDPCPELREACREAARLPVHECDVPTGQRPERVERTRDLPFDVEGKGKPARERIGQCDGQV